MLSRDRSVYFLFLCNDFPFWRFFMKKVALIMGSDSDLPILEKAMDVLTEYGVPFETHVYSAHRTPDQARNFAQAARANGFGVLICAAGMAAHLAGAFAANTTLPVIGIPVKSAGLGGMDALLSTVMMPSGIPVATVAIDGAKNAALLAIEILALSDESLADKLDQARIAGAEAVLEKDRIVDSKYSHYVTQ
jgi:5-(carboxyamino)imidazole ribonucleotide mutase